jgi:hypothetical protein
MDSLIPQRLQILKGDLQNLKGFSKELEKRQSLEDWVWRCLYHSAFFYPPVFSQLPFFTGLKHNGTKQLVKNPFIIRAY